MLTCVMQAFQRHLELLPRQKPVGANDFKILRDNARQGSHRMYHVNGFVISRPLEAQIRPLEAKIIN